jgi:integrase
VAPQHESRLKNTTYNEYARLLKNLFEIAVSDRVLVRSPFAEVTTKWKKPQRPIRLTPTEEEFFAIVRDIRAQKYSPDAEDSADFIEFLGLAGLGQKEASTLKWGDIDQKGGRITLRRHKTSVVFHVPIYPQLKLLLQRLEQKAKNSQHETVLQIGDAKKALRAACTRLGLPHFSQRAIRRVLIQKLWKAGVDKKLIAKWQGHSDGGKLIMDTYTETFGSDDDKYEEQELAKITPSILVRESKGEKSMV